MKRTITEKLLKWKDSKRRKPLVISGVRQCGKTYIIKKFGEENFENIVYLNFEESEKFGSFFEYDYDVNRIVSEIEEEFSCTISDGKTLLVFDEIQKCSRAITSLKYFCENRRKLHVVCAGSLLGIEMRKEGTSFPVGKVEMLQMYPMSFYEFAKADGCEKAIEAIGKYAKDREIPDLYAEPLIKRLKTYYLVGGMPEVVAAWTESHDYNEVTNIQDAILSGYRNDFAKHAPAKDVPKINWIWDALPQQLAKDNHKFIFSQVKKGARARDLEDALQWLVDAGLCHKLERVENPEFPLSYCSDSTYFKLYACDVGLLSRLSKLDMKTVLDGTPLFDRFKGAITENYVMQQFMEMGYESFFWKSGNIAEIDFLIEYGGEIIPVEVKAADNTRAKSYSMFCRKYRPKNGFKLSLKNVGKNMTEDTETHSLPLYDVFRIGEYIGKQ